VCPVDPGPINIRLPYQYKLEPLTLDEAKRLANPNLAFEEVLAKEFGQVCFPLTIRLSSFKIQIAQLLRDLDFAIGEYIEKNKPSCFEPVEGIGRRQPAGWIRSH
jgi:hypothetical protein